MIRIENLEVKISKFFLGPIDLFVEKGEFFVILGPTGAGKTVLLETIAGLYKSRKGKIFIDGEDVTDYPPERRKIGIVYQDFSLFPHMNVRENIIYGLKMKGVGKKDITEKLNELLKLLDIAPLLERSPDTLSGGEKQKVALARALSTSPSVVLLDEPLSSLDPNTKREIRKQLKSINRRTNTTFLMITHDISDALSLSDRIAVITDGKVVYQGETYRIFENPDSPFIARFFGIENIFPVSIEGNIATTRKGLRIVIGEYRGDKKAFLVIRPDEIVLSRDYATSSMRNVFYGVVKSVVDFGHFFRVEADVSGEIFKVHITKFSQDELRLKKEDKIFLMFKALSVKIL